MKDDSILRFVTNAVGVTGTQCENEGQGVDARDINLPVDSVDQSFRKKESKLTLQPFQIEDLWMHLRRIEESERLIKKILNECQVAENQSCKS